MSHFNLDFESLLMLQQCPYKSPFQFRLNKSAGFHVCGLNAPVFSLTTFLCVFTGASGEFGNGECCLLRSSSRQLTLPSPLLMVATATFIRYQPYNTACRFLTIQPCLASNVRQWEGKQEYPGIASAQRQDVLTRRFDIKLEKSCFWLPGGHAD